MLLEIPKISGDRLSSRGWKWSVPLFCYSLGCGCDWRQLGLQVNSEIKWRKLMEKQWNPVFCWPFLIDIFCVHPSTSYLPHQLNGREEWSQCLPYSSFRPLPDLPSSIPIIWGLCYCFSLRLVLFPFSNLWAKITRLDIYFENIYTFDLEIFKNIFEFLFREIFL